MINNTIMSVDAANIEREIKGAIADFRKVFNREPSTAVVCKEWFDFTRQYLKKLGLKTSSAQGEYLAPNTILLT